MAALLVVFLASGSSFFCGPTPSQHVLSVHRAVLRASLPSVVTKHRLVRRTLRNPDEAEAKSFKELRLVLWTVYYNHSWFSIASVYSRDHPRWRRCLLAFFETMIIAVCEAVTAWVSYPVGLCKVADDAASCENIRSSTSFGTDNNCRWDVSTEPECVFDPPRGSGEIFFMRLQMAVVSVAITLPLLKFANWIFDSYVFAPVVTAAELAAPGDVALGAAQASAKRSGDAFFAVGHFAEAAEAYLSLIHI